MLRIAKNLSKLMARKTFEIGQRFGINVLPYHFYSEIPNIADLRKNDHWKQRHSMLGINGSDIDGQISFAKHCCKGLTEKMRDDDIYYYACKQNGAMGFGPIESYFLYCFIHSRRPKKIIQIGAGVSTAVMIAAAREAAYSPEIICIDPFPTKFLLAANKSGEISLITKKAQMVNREIITDLGTDQFLFIDSTHAVKTGSEVNMLIIEALPRLRKGCHVHFHDIHFPYDYPRRVLTTELFFSNETTLLYAFLLNNYKYRLNISLSMLHYDNPSELKCIFPSYAPAGNDHGLQTHTGHFPSSAYLEVVA